MNDNYRCSICKTVGKKLWSPYGNFKTLICATCAEKRQVPRYCSEIIWTKAGKGELTGKKKKMLAWKVNSKGEIPAELDNNPFSAVITTVELVIDLSKEFPEYVGETTLIPAYLCNNEYSLALLALKEDKEYWQNLPTR